MVFTSKTPLPLYMKTNDRSLTFFDKKQYEDNNNIFCLHTKHITYFYTTVYFLMFFVICKQYFLHEEIPFFYFFCRFSAVKIKNVFTVMYNLMS